MTPAVVHSQRFQEKFPLGKHDSKIVFFLNFEKFCHWYMAETCLNTNWYCWKFDLTGCDLGFTARFWISFWNDFFVPFEMISLLWTLSVNSVKISGFGKNCDVQIIWKLSNVILGQYFGTLWTLNYDDCIPFSYIDFFRMALIQVENIMKFYSRISKNHGQTSIFAERVL